MKKNKDSPSNAEDTPCWKLIVVVITPILLLPLPLVVEGTASKCAYVVLLMTVYWMTEAVPLAATALLPIGLYPLLGVESAPDTAANYFKDTNFLIFGSLLMAVAVEITGLHYRIALRILLWFGAKPQWLIFGFMNTAGFLSMWISNTATCAMMMPIVIVVLEEILRHHRRVRASEMQHPAEQHDGTVEPHASPFEGELSPDELGFCRAACIGISFASSVGGIGALTGATPNLILTGQLSQFYPRQNAITFANWFAFGLPMQFLFMIVGWIWLLVLFMGWRHGLRCFGKHTDTDKSISKILRMRYEKLGPIRFAEVVVVTLFTIVIILWVTREPGFVAGWGSWFKSNYVSDSTPVMLACFILFAFPTDFAPFLAWRKRRISSSSLEQQSEHSNGQSRCALPSTQSIICWRHLQDKFSWSVIILLGGGFALADGVKKSGLSDWLGCSLQSSMSNINPAATVLVFLILMTVISEFASNTATASVFVPILLTVAESLKVNPMYFGMSAAIGASFGFMLPVATPPNMIVFEKCKQLRILGPIDMIKAGLGLDIICISIAFLAMHTTGYWVYSFNVYPDWAHSASNYSACNRTSL